MQRRTMLAALGSAAVGGATAVSTGAFTSVEANRSVSVNVASDSDALLALDTTNAGPNSEYASGDGSGAVSIDLDNSDDGGGAGLNVDAEIDIFDIFRVRNQGTQPVFVYADPDSVTDSVSGDPDDDGNNEFGDADGVYIDPQATSRPNAVNFTSGRGGISFTGIYGVADPTAGFPSGNPYEAADLTLGVGESLNFGLFVDTTGADTVDFDVSMDIVADEEVAADI